MAAENPHLFTVSSEAASPAEAAGEIAKRALAEAKGRPIQGAMFSASVSHPVEQLQPALGASLPRVPFLGATSCLGVGVSGKGLVRGNIVSGLFLAGEGFTFATAIEPKRGPAHGVGTRLGQRLKQQVPRPRLVFLHATPGEEEKVLSGLAAELPAGIPTIGATAADNDLSGKWSVWTQDGFSRDGVVTAVTDWPWRLATNYQGGYMTAERRGLITKAQGRTLLEIDGRPAAEVYNEWIKGKLDEELKGGGNVLAKTTLCPVGVVRSVGTAEMYLLAHPERVSASDHSLSLFTEIKQGETIALMKSSPAALEQRGANVARRALTWSKLEPAQVLGAYFVYCGGCLLAIQDRASEMVAEFEGAIGKRPFLSHFAFGEQGSVWPGSPVDHGNLMASVVLFSAEPAIP